ncbi:unnamed protein product [Ectocarpus sp. 4 AP-2014]
MESRPTVINVLSTTGIVTIERGYDILRDIKKLGRYFRPQPVGDIIEPKCWIIKAGSDERARSIAEELKTCAGLHAQTFAGRVSKDSRGSLLDEGLLKSPKKSKYYEEVLMSDATNLRGKRTTHARPRRSEVIMDGTGTSSGYCAKSVAEAWKHHLESFAEGDMDKLRLDYDEECLITCYNVPTNATTVYHGKEGGVDIITYVTNGVKDSSKTEDLVSEIFEDKKTTFVAWKNLDSGIPVATCTSVLNDKFQIICQTVVLMFPETT